MTNDYFFVLDRCCCRSDLRAFLLVAYARVPIGDKIFYTPCAMFDKLPPYAKRATWAHQNTFEAFMVFAAVALMACVTGVNSPIAVGAAIAFVVARLLYSIFYILNKPLLHEHYPS